MNIINNIKKKKKLKKGVKIEIAKIENLMLELDPLDEKYEKYAARLKTLYEINEIKFKGRNKVTGDMLTKSSAEIVKTLLVLNYEKLDTIRTKAFKM